ncbi:DUF2066 domain-containing protein [Phytopseudomonas dryadis]|uniref:DUF2066 domain-containing protein n=1 Tax=Phytopseudomonas dryadis TaxID=2487520 RepID=A0A4Q9QZE4_9GAMM|nr:MULTISPECIES: DUF2066 domain-containing protein [Pseudomonas]TBU90003.1 DUF2066 domain-containing protein [Pseudomonas dryadis]TBV02639.1 DUF2066 domain-containing protein [Pseudomonas dryadis]TBV15491.1 DUF2066 domain-containing protein [Pseudomonas sp. FRB 230]
MRPTSCVFLLCLSLLSLTSAAATVSDLYQVREKVASQQPQERDAAMQRALETLVLRLTGNRDAAKGSALAELRKDPQQIVSQYGYEGDSLLVDFDAVSTDRTLRQAGLPLWGVNRPALLTWWLSDTAAGSNMVGDGQASAEPLRLAAQHRGLPLRLPLADLDEQLLATADNLGASDPEALRSASERYGADALLAVHARETDDKWQADWQMWLGEEHEQGKAEGADQAALADAVLLAVSERLAPRFVVTPGTSSTLTLEVIGADLSRYAELQRMLEPFAAQLQSVEADRLVYRVNASAEQLRAQLALAQLHEVPADEALPEPAPANDETLPIDATQAPLEPAAQEPAPRIVPRGDVLRFRW